MVATGGYVPRRVARQASWLLAATTRLGHRLVDEHLPDRLRRQHYLVLAGLAELDAPAQADLSRMLRVDGSDLVTILNDLEALGYVTRHRSAADRRRNTVTPTRRGREFLCQLDDAVQKANDTLLACLSPLERELLVSLLIRLLINAETTDTVPAPAGSQPRHVVAPTPRSQG
jgi:DNA-binding MarR family transcriptional regulator